MGKLTVLKVNSLRNPGMYPDGDGLYLQVTGPQSRSWIYRYTTNGKARWAGLGSSSSVTLAEAREQRDEYRKQIRGGSDPVAERRAPRAPEEAPRITFRAAAESYLEAQHTWRNAKHRWQWSSTLERFVFPIVGEKPVAEIERADIIKILEPIWTTKAETARRVRGRIETVIDWAIARDTRLRVDNPARRGPLEKGLPKQSNSVEHHAALPYKDIGTFMADLRGREGVAAAAFEFLVLTAARTGEVIGATWNEIDVACAMWTIPPLRMKAGRPHRVPLSESAMAILERMRGREHDFVFPGLRAGRGLSNMSLLKLLQRMNYCDITAHGFRSAFRTWAAEQTDFPREIVETALAHVAGDKVEAAYQRGDLLEKRRRLMDAWADYCGKVPSIGAVVRFRTG